jgi:serine protease Do
VQADDVIVALDGTALEAMRDLQRLVSTTPVGKRVRVVVVRGGEQKEMEITIGRYRERTERRPSSP